jgi:hypothetical protein
MKILFLGDLNQYGRSYYRFEVLRELGYDVDAISYVPIVEFGVIHKPNILQRIFWKLKIPFNDNGSNKALLECCNLTHYEVLWVEKGLLICPWVLKEIRKIRPNIKIMLFSEDDLCVSHGLSLWLILSFKLYDAVITTKLHNISELLERYQARKVFHIPDTYFKSYHAPQNLTEAEFSEYQSDVSAIGAYEENRAEYLIYLAKKGIKVNVWGSGWGHLSDLMPEKLHIKNKFLVGLEYSKAICASKININFLRKINRDQITSRSIEIPASGGFMLTESSSVHSKVFNMGIDADCFSSKDELLTKVIYYLENTEIRKKIAKSGRYRVQSLQLDADTVLNKILENLTSKTLSNENCIYI